MSESFEAVIIGAGQAGLAMSHHLTTRGVGHVVLEQGRVGESWRSQRWDSFALNTPGWASRLPNDGRGAGLADEFARRDDFVSYLERYADHQRLPIRSGVTVTSVVAADGEDGFVVEASGSEPIRAKSVVVASGIQRVPRIPAVAAALPASVTQLHSSEYRNAGALPSGAVLVVGSAQSGGQIAEDLLDAGRVVYLSTSRVGRMPRRYRGRDIFEWLMDFGFFRQTVATLPNPALQFAPQPIISGINRHGHTLSLQYLAGRGARLLGHLGGAADGRLLFDDDLGTNIAWGDERSADVRRTTDDWIQRIGADAPPPEVDPADVAHPDPGSVHGPESLDLDDAGISTVIWTTGVQGDFGWLPAAAVGPGGRPIQSDGVASIPGLYFLGLPWLRSRASGVIPGAGPDAAFVADLITA